MGPGGGAPARTPVEILAGFSRALRETGLAVTTEATATFVDAVAHLDYGRRADVYWAGRATFCARAEDLPSYDRAFEAWFAGLDAPPPAGPGESGRAERRAGVHPGAAGDSEAIAALASMAERLRHRDIAQLSAAERALLEHEFDTLPVRLPTRRTRRLEVAGHGRIDRVRTLRDQLRRAGEPGPLRHARRRRRARRIVLLIDVSGSMKPYADALLRLAHRVCRAAPAGGVEVFTLGTRLTRVTEAMRRPDAHAALVAAGETIPDWAGGTRLADALEAFLRRWGRRGLARGAVVVIASDGWERGDPQRLAGQLRVLAGLAHRVVWSNPHAGKEGYEPVQSGIVAALPHLDALVAGHSIAAFEELLATIGAARGDSARRRPSEGPVARNGRRPHA
ncbi:VWA domain-containing protein [Pseudactinotalea sp. HY158]|uniref:vWA domain-containing protein n=1 Tax=Pseudactinotalea sp. HY158 TaxID=2654547 RepID=UPI00129C43D6|nr:VWA domain-containing protein [Pseudactinotalea sp. HY158]QGH69939.1 VWA domain-containing protein [Pseudactinotalea sp. HY158]